MDEYTNHSKHKILYTKGLIWLLEIQEKLTWSYQRMVQIDLFPFFVKTFFLLTLLDSDVHTDFAHIKVITEIICLFD